MTHDPLANLDEPVCRCERCTGQLEWPDWATPRLALEWRDIETIKVTGGRL